MGSGIGDLRVQNKTKKKRVCVRVRDSERKRGETKQNASTSCVLLQRKEKEKIQASRNQKTSSQVESSQVIGERKVDSVYRTKVKERQEKKEEENPELERELR